MAQDYGAEVLYLGTIGIRQCAIGQLIRKAGNTHARKALVEGACASRYPAKVSRHLQLRLETQPKIIQSLPWSPSRDISPHFTGREVLLQFEENIQGYIDLEFREFAVTRPLHCLDTY